MISIVYAHRPVGAKTWQVVRDIRRGFSVYPKPLVKGLSLRAARRIAEVASKGARELAEAEARYQRAHAGEQEDAS
jgi:hypothetical protein